MILDLIFKNLKPKTTKSSKGFTLVEMIISLGLFTAVMLIVISVLTSVAGANEKARTLRIVIDNLNFAVENMARTMRVGSDYHCGNTGTLTSSQDCSVSGDSFIAFLNIQSGGVTTAFKREDVVGIGAIFRSNECAGSSGCAGSDGNGWRRITAPEIDVGVLKFYVEGSGENDGKQAQILIITSGTAGKGAVQTDFNIQTTVTQRKADS